MTSHIHVIDRIRVMYGSSLAPLHGSDGGNSSSVLLSVGEYITDIGGQWFADDTGTLSQLWFITNLLASHGPFGGKTGGVPFAISSGSKQLLWVAGRDGGDVINELIFIFAC